jgi:hypothetical protein
MRYEILIGSPYLVATAFIDLLVHHLYSTAAKQECREALPPPC